MWLAFPGSPISVRLRFATSTPAGRAVLSLAGKDHPFEQVLALLPPLTAADFKPTPITPPELRADIDGWHISIHSSRQTMGGTSVPDVLADLQAWVERHLTRG